MDETSAGAKRSPDQTLDPTNPGGAAKTYSGQFAAPPTLANGRVLGGRYEILQLLGQGGMGAVYKARDLEVDRVVGLKVIRPELAASGPILQRFKQELVLARQITHRNIIRIYDLGEADGMKFITMEYVEGQDLRSVLKTRGKLPPEEATRIVDQIVHGLQAAHQEGVVHRDLKPGNIMLDQNGRVVVMDFGLARTLEGDGMTQTGMMLGTMEYMSPEQAQAKDVDGRSDLFTVGLIFYELLTGEVPYKADSALASLLKRSQERAIPVAEKDKSIPKNISNVVSKCLEPDPASRYQSSAEMLQDLAILQGKSAGPMSATDRPAIVVPKKTLPVTWIAVVAAVLVLAVATTWFLSRGKAGPATSHAPMSLLVADFKNGTPDAVFDETLEPAFSVAIEGAPFITAYNRGSARKIGARLKPGAGSLDESLARLVAVREGINVVVGGSISPDGSGYQVAMNAMDAATGKTIFSGSETAGSKQEVLAVVSKLAAKIRTALGDATPESVQLAASETFTAESLEAAHEYAVAQRLQWGGKWDDAIQHYLKAIQLDPNMGRAYAGVAAVYTNTGRHQEAEKYYKLALSKMDRMSDREKYRTRGLYYVSERDPDKAIDELSGLVKQYPADTAGIANLALAYFYKRDMQRALDEGRRAVEILPKNVPQRNNVGLYAMYAGDFESAIREQQAVLELNQNFVLAYVGMALSQTGKGDLEAATETWRKLQATGPDGTSAAMVGLADLAMYQGQYSEAASILEKGAQADEANKNPEAAAIKWADLAQANVQMVRLGPAKAAIEKAVAESKDTGVMFWAARTYEEMNQDAKALDIARQLSSRLEPDPQAYAKVIQGELELRHGRAREAVALFTDAQKLADTWLGRFDLGRAYIELGAFPQADSALEICLKRRGEATAVFLDENPSYHLLPPLYYYLGRAQEGLKSAAAAESYKTFLAIKTKSESDPLVADAKKRLDGLK